MSGVALGMYCAAWAAGLAALSPALAGAALAGRWGVRRRLWPRRARPSGDWWWWHGASAGEVRGLTALYSAMGRNGDRWFTTVSSATEAGVSMWEHLGIGDEKPHILPLDLPACWRRVMPDRAPRLVVLSETELWPAWLSWLAARRVPVVIVSGRLSRTTRRRLVASRLLHGMVGNLYVAAQTHADRGEYLGLGVAAAHVIVTGSLKWPRTAPLAREAARARLGLEPDEPVVVAGSLRHSELRPFVSMLERLRMRARGLRCILVPRMTGDCRRAERIVRVSGFSVQRWSRVHETGARWDSDVLLVDTLGDLAWLYGAGTMAVIGGSWEPVGGHNPFEAAVYGIPVAYGPHMAQPGDERLEQTGQATRLADWGELEDALAGWLAHPPVVCRSQYPDAIQATINAWRTWGIVPHSAGIR